MAIFVERVGELPRLLDALQYHPEGLRIDDLAVEVGRTPAQVREALLTYYTTDLALYDADLVGRPPAIEFVLGAGEDDDLDRASIVRLQAPEPGRELGVAYLSVTELARLYRAGRDRLDLEPDNDTLRSAVNKLRAGLLPGAPRQCGVRWNRHQNNSQWVSRADRPYLTGLRCQGARQERSFLCSTWACGWASLETLVNK